MSIENLTPPSLRCVRGGCPSIHRVGDKLVSVGKYASHMDGEIGDLRDRLGKANKIDADETAIVVDEALLSDVIAGKVKDLVHATTESDRPRSGQPSAGWMPIETAPRDGTWVWAFYPLDTFEDRQCPAQFTDAGGCEDFPMWWDNAQQRDDIQPTHWRPLPSSPLDAEQAK